MSKVAEADGRGLVQEGEDRKVIDPTCIIHLSVLKPLMAYFSMVSFCRVRVLLALSAVVATVLHALCSDSTLVELQLEHGAERSFWRATLIGPIMRTRACRCLISRRPQNEDRSAKSPSSRQTPCLVSCHTFSTARLLGLENPQLAVNTNVHTIGADGDPPIGCGV